MSPMSPMNHLRWTPVAIAILGSSAVGQSWSDRMAHLEGVQQERAVDQAAVEAAARDDLAGRMRTVLQRADLENVPAREAFRWWSEATGVSLVIDWRALDEGGMSGDSPVSVQLEGATAGQVLAVLMRAVQADGLDPDNRLMFEPHDGRWLELTTRAGLNRRLVTRVYNVQDLVFEVPNFDDAPPFELNQSLSNTRSGGSTPESRGGGGRQAGVFQEVPVEAAATPTKGERGEAMVTLVKQMVETDVWQDAGGAASIQYLDGRLIVRAPMYVQRQIGMDEAPGSRGWSREGGGDATSRTRFAAASSDNDATATATASRRRAPARDSRLPTRYGVVDLGNTTGVQREQARTSGVAARR